MFEKPEFLWALLVLPAFIFLLAMEIFLIKKRSEKIAGSNINRVIPYYSEGQKWIKLVLYVLAFVLAVLALARPRWGLETIEAKSEGRDVLLLLDVSYSMAAYDVIPDRLESAKRGILELLSSESGDRFGLMIFSGESELISPVTFDYAAINFFLDSIYPGMLGKGGTNIGEALTNSLEAFDSDGVSNKMILLITDGENLQGDLNRELSQVKDNGIKVFTVGVGTEKGKPIPVLDAKGEVQTYVKDENNQTVMSRMDEKQLKNIAEQTDGAYLGTTNEKGALRNALQNVSSVLKKEQQEIKFEQKRERYDLFLLPALILFCLGVILDQGRLFRFGSTKFNWIFNKRLNLMFFIILFSAGAVTAFHAEDKKTINTGFNGGYWGNKDFYKEKYDKAIENYVSAANKYKDEQLAKINYNLANTYYKLNDFNRSGKLYENALSLTKDNELKSMILYNQGLSAFKKKEFSEALKLFKSSMQYNDQDDDARYNYEVCRELIKNSKDNKDQEQNKDNKDEKKDEKKEEKKQENKMNDDKSQMSKEDIDKMLKALEEKEQKENKERSNNEQKRNSGKVRYW